MTDTMTSATAANSGANAPLEKIPLETYVPPARPSLIGLSRAEIAERLGEIGVAPAQRKMRTQQLWHWMYVRGAKDFDAMRKSADVTVKGVSAKGTETTDTFSLKGLSQALDKLAQDCKR